MAEVKIFWDPGGLELDSVGRRTFRRVSDGDTPYVEMSIRMLSVDTPEIHYPGNTNPARHDEGLAELAEWMQAGKAPISDELAERLQPRLASGRAGTLQKEQGVLAKQAFEAMLEARLRRPSGSRRQVYLHTGDEPFDQYGRLLAYMAPSYTTQEREAMTPRERATFNLQLIESGWAASFPIFPSLPKHSDLVMLREVAREALDAPRGVWGDPLSLTGYEFRMCFRLWGVTRRLERGERLSSRVRNGWVDRYCVDMTTREIFLPQDYYRVAPCNRIFVWPKDVNRAVAQLSLIPAP